VTAFAHAFHELRTAWRPRETISVAAFAAAALAPLVFGEARTADLANGLYLACAAVGLAFAVGIAGLPLLAQGGFVAVGAVVSAHLLASGLPTPVAALAGGVAGGLAGACRLVPSHACLPPGRRWRSDVDRRGGWSQRSPCSRSRGSSAARRARRLAAPTAGRTTSPAAAHWPPRWEPRRACPFRYLQARWRLASARRRVRSGVPVNCRARGHHPQPGHSQRASPGAFAVQQLAGVGDATCAPLPLVPPLRRRVGSAVRRTARRPVGVVVLGVPGRRGLRGTARERRGDTVAPVADGDHAARVVSLGWEGILRAPKRLRSAAAGDELPRRERATPEARGLGKSFGSVNAAEDVALSIEPGRITALVGPNGSGKTTVLVDARRQ
jgi:ABC-type multidrug transport system fused ATPase/permease subunit